MTVQVLSIKEVKTDAEGKQIGPRPDREVLEFLQFVYSRMCFMHTFTQMVERCRLGTGERARRCLTASDYCVGGE